MRLPWANGRKTQSSENGCVPDAFSFLPEGGVAETLIRSIDWTKHPLGNPAAWSPTLKASLGIIFGSHQPMFLWWGPERIQFYNAAGRTALDPRKHPASFGQPGRACWPEEVWHELSRPIDASMARGESNLSSQRDVPIFRGTQRNGVVWSMGYSPIRETDGSVVATLLVCSEIMSVPEADPTPFDTVSGAEALRDGLLDFFMQAPVPMCILKGPEHRFILANPLYEKLVGRRVTGKTIREAFARREAAAYIQILDEVYQTGVPYIGKELPLLLANASGGEEELWLDVGYHPYNDSHGCAQPRSSHPAHRN